MEKQENWMQSLKVSDLCKPVWLAYTRNKLNALPIQKEEEKEGIRERMEIEMKRMR